MPGYSRRGVAAAAVLASWLASPTLSYCVHAFGLQMSSELSTYRGSADKRGGMARRRLREWRRASRGASASAVSRPLAPPFPNGLCGGTVVTLPPELTYGYTEDDNALIAAATSGGDISAGSILLPPRPIDVWLPPSYDPTGKSGKRHPVLYVHDGQNAIDDGSSWTGSSWRMAGALVRLAERGMLDSSHLGEDVDPVPILVLLPSADGDMLIPGMRRRHLEYGDGPVGQAHADFVVEKVMPMVDARFRTVGPGRPLGNHCLGTSMGGEASFHLIMRHPDKFGGAAALSPAFSAPTIATAAASAATLRDQTLYLDNGGDVGDTKVPMIDPFDHFTEKNWWNPGYFWLDSQLQPGVDAMRGALDLGGVDYEYRRIAGGRHNERAWAQRIDAPLMHLFGRGGGGGPPEELMIMRESEDEI